ncbi:DNA topoisomerase I [Beutenbergia cavernae DSM 12333]|uniref:DNA topoisomerase 1 n=1 Tax=Beutenbergia cavernae (strain ATCC BAA-8 / DSM 12333 / CCUG 43141 / JCM 11478 / NBRC 16432 / NCIMB 13614 / HKI 0122) TaxID=471853 RepID=C5BY25_BEUC1|nr:type I DNA topoisomerase [Beutenbergia cavernae]ACQ78919.1 DNA topoisomerase I [Beutenbergia cavernae DSM 12333]
MPSSARKLVIVESPTKARTITPFLGDDYDVEASVGHIRDLPQPSELPAEMKKGPYRKFAVDVENGFDPYYVVDADKKKKVSELRKKLKAADELYLATDEDREGEAIAWHLLEVLEPKVPVKRMVFHEITREAIQRALEATRDLDTRLVDAQETRRILDRLYGYEVSPVLWRKIGPGLSAGRVQSVATRLVVERERERMAFRSANYWDVRGEFSGGRGETAGTSFSARLTALDGDRVATGRDFDDSGSLTSRAVHLDEAAATALVSALDGVDVVVRSVDTKPYTRRPAAPFTTSTLQQEASRKLRMNSRATMRTAQSLYENGYITYMRTDSVTLSTQAITAARRQAAELYGAEYVPDAPRLYANKSKNAQEAHEAIRPAGDSFRTPAQVASRLSGDEFRLYELIWKRTVASQMADAKGSTASVKLGASAAYPDGATRDAEFSASGTVITFRGFLAAYEEGRDAGRYDEDGDGAGRGSSSGSSAARETRLPDLAQGDQVAAESLTAEGHDTSPPPRYTEASLTAALEERGIGRPSTFAATISVIVDRGYVLRRGQALVPSWLAFSVVRLLEDHFGRLVDYDFTAAMESDLDRIARGEQDRVAWLTRFYFGDEAAGSEGLQQLVSELGDIDARGINSIDLGGGVTVRVGRYGPYLEATGPDGEPQRASVPDDVAPDELTLERARELLATQGEGDRELGTDPATGRTIVARSGRYGPYVTEVIPDDAPAASDDAKPAKRKPAKPKPRTASLLQSMQLEAVDLEQALKLLSLPRVVGVDPESGDEITAQNGRYGPYLKKGTDSRSLETEDQIFDITLEQALAIYAQPKQRRGQRASSALRELGDDPVSGKPVSVKDGRFGPYVTDGTTNATLRKDDEVESITPERAFELLAEKRAKGPAKKRTTARSSSRKAPAKSRS